MKQKSYGEKQRAYAQMLIEQGVSTAEILKDSAMQGFKAATLRSMRKRMNERKSATQVQKVAPVATKKETMQRDATQPIEPDNTQKQPESIGFWRQWRATFHPADLLYYLAVSLAAAGIVQALHLVGYPVAVLLCAGAFIALHGIKTTTGWKRLPHFAIMAVIEAGSFAAHTVWANKSLWDGVKSLPLDIWENKYRNDLGEIVYLYGGNDVQVPGKIAIGIASFMLTCTVYVCWLAIQNSNKTKN